MAYYLAVSQPGSPRQLQNVVEENHRLVDGVILVGGVSRPETAVFLAESLGLEVYAVTGPMDDHYVAQTLALHGKLVEGRLRYMGGGFFVTGVNGRDPVTSIMQLVEKMREYRGRLVVIGFHGVKDCGDRVEGLRSGVGLYEARRLVQVLKPPLYITARTPKASTCRLGGTLVVSTGWLREGEYVVIELPILSVFAGRERRML